MTVTQSAIDELSRQIAARFRPERIILFGSHARGEAKETSDVDLLIVMPIQGREIDKAVEIVKDVRPPFGVDILVRTPERLRERIALGDFFLREVMAQGKVLYDATDR